MFTLSRSHHHHHLSPELFSGCETESLDPLNTELPASPPLAQPTDGTHHSTFCPCESDGRRSLQKWNHSVFLFLCLAYFTLRDVLQARPGCSIRQELLPLRG